jgi:hypothetical protein
MIKDKQTVVEQVYNEYNTKFVAPKIFVRQQDESVGTDPIDFELSSPPSVRR